MTAKHTPGPWVWTADDAGPRDEYGCTTRGPIDMRTFKARGYYGNPELYAGDKQVISAGCGEYNPVYCDDREESAANAALIAAAPDLLEAARGLTPIRSADDGAVVIGPQGWANMQALLKRLENV